MITIREDIHERSPVDMAIFERVRTFDPDLYNLQAEFLISNGHAYDTMRPRFSQHDTGKAFTSTRAFKEDLGPDVAHETHPLAQLDVVRQFRLPHELGLAAIMHDWGETHPLVGDPQYTEQKAKGAEGLEATHLEMCARAIFGPEKGSTLAQRILSQIDPKTELGFYFKISERIGYMKTILRAAELAIFSEKYPFRMVHNKRQIAALWSIAGDAKYHIAPLQTFAEDNTFVDVFMNTHAHLIETIQARAVTTA